MIEINLNDIQMKFKTNRALFSPNALDNGTKAMLNCVSFSGTDKVLDLGCGYGIVGIYSAKLIGSKNVIMSDIDEKAIETAMYNTAINDVADIRIIRSDGFSDMEDTDFTIILSNPPYHTDFKIAKHFIEKGFNRLVLGGKMVMVAKRKEWYKNKFTSIFGGVTIKTVDGYFVFIADKRSYDYAKNKTGE